ncbi:MAG: phosphate ABC transporter substrate-binding protein PstS [Parafilimonas sp.]
MKLFKNIKVAATFFLAASLLGSITTQAQGDDNTILGAGSTFVYPLFSKLFSVYHQKTKLQVNYQSIGSGGGILQLTNKTVDFGDSDAPLTDDQSKKMGADVLHIPMCAGAVSITYNLPGVNASLNFTPAVLANIFLGKIKTWNDASIVALNKGIKIPAFPIIIAHRTDGSGTTNIFTHYLSAVSPEWSSKVGSGGAVNWPAGLGGKGSEGVAGLIKQTPGTIGYVELAYAVQNKMPQAKIQNAKGQFVAPSVASTIAASNTKLPADSKAFIVNSATANAYPIAGFTWALIYKEQNYSNRSGARAQKLLQLLWWNIHEGQQYCQGLTYAPLSPSATKTAEAILKSATFNGKPILK